MQEDLNIKYMNLLNLSCKKATEMVEQEKMESLTFINKLKLELHLSVCKPCQGYQKQSQLIADFFSKENHNDEFEKIHYRGSK